MIKDYLTYIKESVTEEFKIGDEVFVNGDVDGKNFHGDTDFISDIGKIMVYTNMNEKGKCSPYSYLGKSFYLSKAHWWVSPFNLKKAPKRERLITANDPYGEEIVESVKEKNFYKIRDIFDKHDNIEDFINELKDIFMGKNISVMEYIKEGDFDGWSEIADGWGNMLVNNIKWDKGADGKLNKSYEDVRRSDDERHFPYVIQLNNGLRVQLCEAIKIVNVKITKDDPYGEEEWEEEIHEAVKKDKGVLYSIDRVLRAVPYSVSQLMNNMDTEQKRQLIINHLDRLKGKKIVFYNHKEGRNIKKERIMDDAYWARVPGGFQLMITGTKKDYVVNTTLPIGYYMEGGPKRNICPLDPYGEEDWEN